MAFYQKSSLDELADFESYQNKDIWALPIKDTDEELCCKYDSSYNFNT